MKFPGFLAVYEEKNDDEEKEDERRMLPTLEEGQSLTLLDLHFRTSLHPPTSTLYGSFACQRTGKIRHRPPLDLCHDHE